MVGHWPGLARAVDGERAERDAVEQGRLLNCLGQNTSRPQRKQRFECFIPQLLQSRAITPEATGSPQLMQERAVLRAQ